MASGEAGGSSESFDPSPARDDARFGEGLEAALIETCRPRLSDIRWFRTDWQRGGALTGYADYETDEGPRRAMVKLPVPPRELAWLRRLQPTEHDAGPVVPELFASGDATDGYDLAWAVMERLPHGPLDSQWDGRQWELLIEALGRFQRAASAVPVDKPPRQEDWPAIIDRARRNVRDQRPPDAQHWNQSLKALQKKLKTIVAQWDARPTDHWCHGDVHLANAMTRVPPPDGPALIFDLAEVHAGHWVEDAVYLEHIYWGRERQLPDARFAKQVARQRKTLGLPGDPDWPHFANLRRALLAAAAPAYMREEGQAAHLQGALAVLDQALAQIKA